MVLEGSLRKEVMSSGGNWGHWLPSGDDIVDFVELQAEDGE